MRFAQNYLQREILRMEARFSVVSGPCRGQTYQILPGKFIIGREPDCQLAVDSSFVSRHHCVFLMDEYTVRIRDLGSKNGTFVNEEPVRSGERILTHGDTIRVGDLIIRFELSVGPSIATSSPETDAGQRDTT